MKCLSCVPINNPQRLLSVYVTFGWREKSLVQLSEKTRLFGKTSCFRIHISLLNAMFDNFWSLAALIRLLPNSGWLSLTSEKTNSLFQLSLFFKLAVFCLVSPDFATCSLALRKHVVSDAIKRLSTFASLELSTLAAIFFPFETSLRVSSFQI